MLFMVVVLGGNFRVVEVYIYHVFLTCNAGTSSPRPQVQHLNLQWRKLYWEEGKRFVKLRLSTKGIKTIDKYGLHKAAKKFDLDLVKFTA